MAAPRARPITPKCSPFVRHKLLVRPRTFSAFDLWQHYSIFLNLVQG
jgi:hypothetical protein